MNKSELIKAMSEQCGLSIKQTENALNAFCTTVSDELAQGKEVGLVGFGSFVVVQRAERKGRNPKTGKEVKITARKVVKFKAGKPLKEAINIAV